ncbi:diguanylate cyclase domain-containing protein [Quadrisphaera sp. DSM 44207]|uniref:diguanylate cyclase domain-containing protein n=1 Tax=Quadrisphaera sp. DSM 44207 TaxID=1881057 RepID=UPI00087EF1C2|nr:diguanylate cyclase [Quadrisphaera sp. DSM 44207]SDQ34423.1 PAS domain S-box-containing protein/diguanylate cyclase (GGDEF) domain-containing protein [Quadrisphaera sp. DSM 44207]
MVNAAGRDPGAALLLAPFAPFATSAARGAGAPSRPADALTSVREIVDAGALRTVFQPIVSLEDRRVVAFEALTRGPAGTVLERPDVLFSAARRDGLLVELDVACRAAALRTAAVGGLSAPYHLFLNTEPDSVADLDVPEELHGVPVVLELTERALTRRPAQVLRVVEQARALGWAIALDDVGAEPASLALLPLVSPDVIKLDLALVQERPGRHAAAVMNAVTAQAERTGAVLLAEGIETERHVLMARTMGATLGQGWLFGRPEPLPAALPELGGRGITLGVAPLAPPAQSPYLTAQAVRTPRPGNKRLLVEVSKHLEAKALEGGESALLLATFQYAKHFTEPTQKRYARLAERLSLVAAIGEGLPLEPIRGVRGAQIPEGDPVLGEWDVVVLTPDFAGVLVARDLGDSGPDMERRFDFVLSHDRDVAVAVARGLLARVAPEPSPSDVLTEPVLTRAMSQDLLHQALEATITGVCVADVKHPHQPLVWVNPAFEALTGYRSDDVIGRNCRVLQGPGSDPVVVARIREAIDAGRECTETLRNYRRDGHPWWNELHLSPVRDDHGELTHYIAVQHDVTRRVEAEQRALQLATTDALTGLPNRTALHEAAASGLARVHDEEGTAVAVLYVDLDGFKGVNDRHGHVEGDAVLRAAAQRLRGAVRIGDVIGRQGGDEFLLVLPDLPTGEAGALAEAAAQRLVSALAEPFTVDGRSLPLGASIGVALYGRDPDGQLPADGLGGLLRRADEAMFTAKRAGGSRWHR